MKYIQIALFLVFVFIISSCSKEDDSIIGRMEGVYEGNTTEFYYDGTPTLASPATCYIDKRGDNSFYLRVTRASTMGGTYDFENVSATETSTGSTMTFSGEDIGYYYFKDQKLDFTVLVGAGNTRITYHFLGYKTDEIFDPYAK